MKIISVIIPTYNRAEYISESLESVLKQNLPKGYKLEVIVADDGSTDNTEQIIKPYLNEIIYLKINHSGKPAVPRNAALRVSSGEIIAFQDSDDIWADNKLINQIPCFNNPKTMISFGQAHIINSKGVRTNKNVVNEKVLRNAKSFSKFIKQNPVCTLTCMVRKSALEEVGYFDESRELRAIEDYNLWLRIVCKYPNGINILPDTVLAFYRMHNNNISKGGGIDGIENAIRIYDSILKLNLSGKMTDILESYSLEMHENWSRQKNIDGETPKISVVMSVYNGERFLREAIDSILNQTYKDFEFIIVNDGSTDRSEKIIRSYKDKRIRLINQKNHGLVYSLNKGVKLARSDLIARMDADDVSKPDRLKEEIKLFNANIRLGLVGTFFELIDFENGQSLGIEITPLTKSIDIKRSMLFVNPIAHGSSMYRKEAYIDSGGYRSDYGPTEDYDLWRRISKNWELEIVPKVLFSYRINNPKSISQSKNKIQASFVEKIRQELASEPFLKKSFKEIITDYNNLSVNIYGKKISKIKDEYINNQYTISKIFINRKELRKTLPTTLSLYFLKPSYGLKLTYMSLKKFFK